MQRLFTSFPDGWPGIGLLLLRFSLVFELAAQMLQRFSAPGRELFVFHMAEVFYVLVAASLLLGFLTPLAAIAGGIFSLSSLSMPANTITSGRTCEWVHLLAFVLSIVLVGPGAYSLDGRLFGQREIIVQRIAASNRKP